MSRKPARRLPASLTMILLAAACSSTGESAPSTQAEGAIATVTYSVMDLVFAKTPVDASGRGDTEGAYIQIADLIQNLKDATDPAYWETEGTGMRPEESGHLQVEAKPEMQQKVAQVLTDMRRLAANK